MIDYKNIKNLYFIGIGGIGMSALARFARHAGKNVAGYDLTETPLTNSLIAEGISVHYIDDPKLIPEDFFPENTLVVRTPAVPAHHQELNWLKKKGYAITKRSELLGYLTREHRCIAVAGTHGKTSVSTMTTHLLTEAGFDTGAFLGGISRNFNSNIVLPRGEHPFMVAEADEFDRSFLQLSPTLAIITSMDADHLDIYGHHEALKEAFNQFIGKVSPEGTVIYKKGLQIIKETAANLTFFTYSINEEADFCVEKLRIEDGAYCFNLKTPYALIENIRFTYPGRVNVENMVAASAAALTLGADPEKIKSGFLRYKGVERRFDIRYQSDNVVYIDDYAHHPEELNATIASVKELYAGKKVLGIFQPHLFSRTRDFSEGFAQSLDQLDEVVLMDIYPARELPIEGISGDTIFKLMKLKKKHRATLHDFPKILKGLSFDVLITLGAGNIDTIVPKITNWLKTEKR